MGIQREERKKVVILCFLVGVWWEFCGFFVGVWWKFAGSVVGIQWEEPEKGNLSGNVEHSRKTTCCIDG